MASGVLHGPYSAQVQGQADELELGLHFFQTAHAELAEAQHRLDLGVGRLDDPLAFAVCLATLGALQLGVHGRRARIRPGVEPDILFSLPAQRDDDLGLRRAQLLEYRFAAVACIGQRLCGARIQIGMDGIEHDGQLRAIGCHVDHLRGHDDVRALVDRRLRVVALVETAAGALHDAAVAVSEALLRAFFRNAEVALVTPSLRLAVLVARLAIVAPA